MNTILLILLLLAMAATAYVLVRGVIAMASGKDVTGEQQQNYMRKRVLFQGAFGDDCLANGEGLMTYEKKKVEGTFESDSRIAESPVDKWSPRQQATGQDLTFWFVARDNRGGVSWASRRGRVQ